MKVINQSSTEYTIGTYNTMTYDMISNSKDVDEVFQQYIVDGYRPRLIEVELYHDHSSYDYEEAFIEYDKFLNYVDEVGYSNIDKVNAVMYKPGDIFRLEMHENRVVIITPPQ